MNTNTVNNGSVDLRKVAPVKKNKSIAGLHTIDVNAMEWFDKVNGNSYHAALVTVNYGLPDAKVIKVPFQYGYGSQYEYSAFKALQEEGIIPKQDAMVSGWRYYEEHNIIARQNIQRGCKKRDLIALTA